MATLATSSSPPSTPSSSSSSCPLWKYDVFLSFCGIDTRKNFTDHVYTALEQKRITTFRDDEKLERGKYISEELLKAIEESKYAIIVLSTNYAFSRWCLKELAKIVECMKKTKLTVLPVFYHVNPSDVRNQMSDNLAKAFAERVEETKVNTEDVQAWKAALKDVGHISGWHVHDRYESNVIQEIIGRICTELHHKFSSVCEELVGMDSCVEEMLGSYLNEGLGGVRFVGICGMGGMGKTTLAREIDGRISKNFQQESGLFDFRRMEVSPLLLVIDRRDDPVTPLLNQWTYQAMVHELIGIQDNKVDLRNIGKLPKDQQEVVLSSEQDAFFKANMYENFGDIGMNIKRLVDEFQQISKSNQSIQTIEDMAKFVDKYPEYRKMHGNVSKHVTLVTEMSKIVEERKLMLVSETEQELACNGGQVAAFEVV